MAPPRPQKFSFRNNSTFSAEESKFIILKYGEVKCAAAVRRAFGTKFLPKNPRKVPHQKQFQRVIDRFLGSASVRPKVPLGLPPDPKESVQAVKDFFLTSPKAHIREAADRLGMSYGQVWKILRKSLKFRA